VLKLFRDRILAQSLSVKVAHMLLWQVREGSRPWRGRHGLVARARFTLGPRRVLVF
jgi:hypothetical protein